MAKKKINSNGFEYIDLGLPSGTLWATMNVGAKKPSDAGLYFQWGDTQGYTKEQVGPVSGKKAFTWKGYKWNLSKDYKLTDGETFTRYNDKNSILELEDDAAHINMGGDWHIPTPAQIQELLDNTTSAWTELDYVGGMTFTSKNDTSKSIFIPAAGYALDGSVHYSGDYGYVWSSMLDTGYADYGQILSFYSGDVGLYYNYRCSGLSVRGVIDNKCDNSKGKKDDDNSKGKKNKIIKLPTS